MLKVLLVVAILFSVQDAKAEQDVIIREHNVHFYCKVDSLYTATYRLDYGTVIFGHSSVMSVDIIAAFSVPELRLNEACVYHIVWIEKSVYKVTVDRLILYKNGSSRLYKVTRDFRVRKYYPRSM